MVGKKLRTLAHEVKQRLRYLIERDLTLTGTWYLIYLIRRVLYIRRYMICMHYIRYLPKQCLVVAWAYKVERG